MNFKTIATTLKPGVSKRMLMLMAAVVWTFAGTMLLFKGSGYMRQSESFLILRLSLSIVGGILFYVFMFSKISQKHIYRIFNLEQEKPCLFSFFNVRSYILMSVMISMGIFLRRSGIVPLFYLSVLYVTMAIPLSLSALRFYYNTFLFKKMKIKNR